MFGRMIGRVPARHLWYLARQMRNERPHRFAGQTRINTFFPPWPSPAFDRFCRAVIARRRVPFSAYLALTPRCPYRCNHCSLAGRGEAELSTEQWRSVIHQLKDLGACTVGFTGGEPMLRHDLPELIAEAKTELATILFTTGHNLSAAQARLLKAAGLDCVTVGIESSNPEEHNAIRAGVKEPGGAGARSGGNGEGVPPGKQKESADDSFYAARLAIAAVQQEGLYTALSTIGTRERLASGELERMYELARCWGVGEFRLLAPVATGAQAGCDAFMLDDAQYAALAEFHIRHNREGKSWLGRLAQVLISLQKESQNKTKKNILDRMSKSRPAVASFAYLESPQMFGCGAGYHHLFIDAAGEVCPCDLTPLSFGNVLHEPLAEIWRRMGERFAQPRRRCLMRDLAGRLNAETLPLCPQRSAELCPPADPAEPLPEGYRRLLR